jgi:phage terminase large subunit GpA-like protein
VLWVFQDDKMRDAHAETRQMPILKSVPAIKSMLSEDRHKTRKADVLLANGLPVVLTGPAIGNLQSRGFKWVICDEAWLYPAGTLGQAKTRLGDFEKMGNSKWLAISQGGEEESDWDFDVKSGVLFVWHVPCEGCGKQIVPVWTARRADNSYAGAVFDVMKKPDGSYDKEGTAKTVKFACPLCGHKHANTEKTRAVWNVGGKYINPLTLEEFDKDNLPSEVSFHWPSLIDTPWEIIVKEWLSAQESKHVGNFAPLVNFLQKRCAEMRSERSIHDADLPFARATITDPTKKTWPDEFARTMTADRQSEDKFWVMIRAWAKTGENRRLFYGYVYGFAAVEAKRIEFGVVPDCTVMDSGYNPKGDHGVYAACIRYGWIAAKGTDEPHFWHSIAQQPPRPQLRVLKPWAPLTYGDPGEGTSTQGRSRCKLFRFSSGVMKDRVMGLIRAGLWVEPDTETEMDKECARQMSAEFKKKKKDKITFKVVEVWVCPTGNNHALDCAAMQVLAAMQLKLIPAGVEMEPEKPKEQNE